MATFRAKARAVDLLGKGQIADLPTAISELWKNGYDAYGDLLSAKFYKKCSNVEKPFFVISDDGKGMSYDDILDKWIVLGTDSKTRAITDIRGDETLGKPPRVKMGEKGIGRLSVAYLGSPMLMLTKKIGNPLQALFIDWRVLENYNLYLEDVVIPLNSILSVEDFDDVFELLKKTFLNNLSDDKKWEEQSSLQNLICNDIKNIKLHSSFKEEFVKPFMGKEADSHGTSFFIFAPDSQLISLSESYRRNKKEEDGDDDTSSLTNIKQSLCALFNVFKETNEEIKTKFEVIDNDGVIDIIDTTEFFSPYDFERGDHLIEGKFEEDGLFKGQLRIYKKEIPHAFRNIKKPGKTSYGSFSIKVGYLQGLEKESNLPSEEFKGLSERLDNFGGLYIYRDGFRVLPYGRQEADFLRFEEQRTKKAGTYFFSYRRMFGYIEITRANNPKLIDKAGREGFINNIAYREFVSDLRAFFKDLAKKYFGTEALSGLKREQQEDIKADKERLENEKEREKGLRKEYNANLTKYIQDFPILTERYKALVFKLNEKREQAGLIYDDIKLLLDGIEDCEMQIKKMYLEEPKRFALTDNQQEKLFKLHRDITSFFEDVVSTSQTVIEESRLKLEEQELYKEFEAKYSKYRNSLNSFFAEYSEKIVSITNELLKKINDEDKRALLEEFDEKYSAIKPASLEKNDILHSLSLLENIFKDLNTKAFNRFNPLIEHLSRLSLDVDEEALTGYFKLKYEEILKQWEQTKELAQMGIAVEIIDHQFNALYSQVAYSISELEKYVPDKEDKALRTYHSLRNNFEHLEDKYKLMSPLYRTTGKIRRNIAGIDIVNYMKKFFESQLERATVTLESSEAFDKVSVYTYESILYPAFINVINNAIYWLTPVESRKIILDCIEDKILILNSGLPIEDFYLEEIFKLFYSKKVSGRGIGLFLARETLRSVGMDIYATNDKRFNYLNGACFIIDTKPLKKGD